MPSHRVVGELTVFELQRNSGQWKTLQFMFTSTCGKKRASQWQNDVDDHSLVNCCTWNSWWKFWALKPYFQHQVITASKEQHVGWSSKVASTARFWSSLEWLKSSQRSSETTVSPGEVGSQRIIADLGRQWVGPWPVLNVSSIHRIQMKEGLERNRGRKVEDLSDLDLSLFPYEHCTSNTCFFTTSMPT